MLSLAMVVMAQVLPPYFKLLDVAIDDIPTSDC